MELRIFSRLYQKENESAHRSPSAFIEEEIEMELEECAEVSFSFLQFLIQAASCLRKMDINQCGRLTGILCRMAELVLVT